MVVALSRGARQGAQAFDSPVAAVCKLNSEVVQTAAPLLAQLERLAQVCFLANDVKPQNVCIGAGDVYKLVDFGAATESHHIVTDLKHLNVTPHYAAPELHDALARASRAGQLTHTLASQTFHFGQSLIDMIATSSGAGKEHYAVSIVFVSGVRGVADELADAV